MFNAFLRAAFVAAVSFVASSQAVLSQTLSNVRIPIENINLISSETLPRSVADEEANNRFYAFDRNTNTGLTLYDNATLNVSLGGARDVHGIRIFGPAPYKLSVSEPNTPDQILLTQDLSGLSEGWHYFPLSNSVSAAQLDVQLALKSGVSATELIEVEFIGVGEHVDASIDTMQEQVISQGTLGQWRAIELVSNAQSILLNSTTPNYTSNFSIGYLASEIREAYLTYEVKGDTALLALSRQINGYSPLGGHPYQPNDTWSQHTEALDPTQINAGDNQVKFAVGSTSNGIEIRNAHIIFELADGAKIVATEALAPVLDGRNDSVSSIVSGTSSVEFKLAKLTSVDGLSLSFTGTPSGNVQAFAVHEGTRHALLDAPVDLASASGALSIPTSGRFAQDIILEFTGVSSTFGLSELDVYGAEVGSTWGTPSLDVTWPINGENYGRVGVLRGVVHGFDVPQGQVEVRVANIPVPLSGGAFEAAVSREQAGFSDDYSTPWSVDVTLVRPDGTTEVQTINFAGISTDDGTGENFIPEPVVELVTPEAPAKIANEEAELDIGSDSVSQKTKISMTPLLAEEVARLDLGMVNVTRGKGKGYRMLPHMNFKKKVKLKIGYDPALIPAGYSDSDINIYFFDEESGRWIALEGVQVEVKGNWVRAETDHFTDFIAGVVVAPESPQNESFNPTQIQGIKAADPTSNINLMEAPSASSSGDANLSYPIQLPAGRLGLAPQLQVSYSSAAQNGWMGLGWNMATPEISVDTRWGVPRYDNSFETETYSFNGQMLTPVAHRTALVPRESNREFHTRIEGGFQKIIRHGTNPSNYWFEVIDKMGTRFAYGGDLNSGAIDLSSVLLSDQGGVFRWKLTEIRDTNGNFVKYHYGKVASTGLKQGTTPGKNIYPERVTYTGYNNVEGPYEVLFTRDRELPDFAERADTIIDGRGGFKQVTADLLRHIEVRLNGETVRAYEFAYAEGAYYKTLLQSITQYGADGNAFNTHSFEYHDDARDNGEYLGFSPKVNWSVPGGDVSKVSALQGAKSSTIGGYINLGFSFLVPSWERAPLTVGAKFGANGTDTDHLIALIDIDGDGLADKVYRQGGQVYYRRNQSGPNGSGTLSYASTPVLVANLPRIGREKTSSGNQTVEVASFGISAGLTWSNGTTESQVYFSDVNGDSLVDLVNGNSVLFNTIDNGVPAFTANVNDTVYPIPDSAASTDVLNVDLSDLLAELQKSAPLTDAVRMWEAPFDGTIQINSNVALVEDISPERADYESADGVRVAIQHESAEIWSDTIAENDYVARAANIGPISVTKGEKIYFRVQSNYDGAYDVVNWAQTIEYVGVDLTQADANDLPYYTYDLANDFTLFGIGNGAVATPKDGTIQISGTLNKSAITTDDVTVELLVNDTVVESHQFAATATGTFTINHSTNVAALEVDSNTGTVVQDADTVTLRLSNDSPIDASAIEWLASDAPRFWYTAFADGSAVLDDQGQPNTVVDLNATIDLFDASNFTAPAMAWTVPQDGLYTFTPEITLAPAVPDGPVFLTFKAAGNRIYKQEYQVTSGTLVAPSFDMAMTAGTEVWIEYSDATGLVAEHIINANVRIELPDPLDVTPPIDLLVDELWAAEVHSPSVIPLLGETYRGWTRFAYNGNEATQPLIISAADFELPDQAELEALGDDIETAANNGVIDDSLRDRVEQKIYPAAPKVANQHWQGPEEEIFFSATEMASSRIANNYPSVPDPTQFAGARGVPQISVTNETNISLGAVFATVSRTNSNSRSILDYMDLNGDSFPDILSQGGKVQYTHMLGALDDVTLNVPNMESNPRKSRSTSTAFGIGGNKPTSMADANGDQSATGMGGNHTPVGSDSLRGTISISASTTNGNAHADYDLRDMNADGLPDLVKQSGNNLVVKLNIGYAFLANEEIWGVTALNDGENNSQALGLGYNSGLNALRFGGGVGQNYSRVLASLADINGDGLMDAVYRGSADNLRVALNSGSGFEAVMDWSTGGQGSEFVESRGENINGGGGFTLYLGLGIFNDIGAGFNASQSTSWTLVRISDLNGDGDPDLLRSNDDGDLRASYGTDGRTNMLKTVNRPLGSTVSLDYTVSGNTYEQPSNRWVMNRVEVFDGFTGDGVDQMVSTFGYVNGYYDRQEREFYGFETVTENHVEVASSGSESVYRTIIHTYDNNSYYSKGLLLSSLTQDAAANPYLATTNTYNFVDVATNSAANLNSLTATVFPQLVRTDKAFFEGQPSAGKSTYTSFEYDDLGNVVRFFDAANLDRASDDVESIIGYHNDNAAYIVGKANSVVVNGNGSEMRRRTAVFEPGTGNLLEVNSFLANGTISKTTLAYDQYGNVTHVEGPANDNNQRYALDYVFDSVTQTYVTETTDSFGYSSSTEYDYRFGAVTLTRDINAQEITNTLDEFGRVLTITGPYQSTDATITFAYNPKLDVPNAPVAYPTVPLSWALTQHIDQYRDPSDPIETVLFADGLGRVLQTKKDATLYDGTNYADKMVASGRIKFDHVGRQIEQYYPVEEPLGNQGIFNPTFDNVAPTQTTYDVLDRPLTITIPDGSSTQMAYDFGTDRLGFTQFRTLFTDAEGKQRETYADVRGLMTAVKEMNPSGGQPTIWTSYDYDPLKQITLVTDDQGNRTTAAYDNLGRQIAINSPDMGLTTFSYDPASNLIAKQTANLRATGAEINYTYDFNRLMAVTYPDFAGNNIAYSYGAPGAADNRANRIVTVQSQGGLEERFYGRLGETVKTIHTIASDTGANPEIYTTEYSYDTWNRLQSAIYPDGEVLVNQYDSGGKLRKIDGTKDGAAFAYLKEMAYDKFGQRMYIKLGNDTETSYSYTADTRRLDALETHSQQTGRTFQQMTYGYDLVGNIVTQANLAQNTQNNLLGGATEYTYEYDDLYRLIGATGSWAAPNNPESFTLSMGYDTIHNIASKDQTHFVKNRVQKKTSYDWTYGYNGAQPHAPTNIGERTYSYDLNGNQTGWTHNSNGTDRTITWDEENRIQSIADNGRTTTYKYNDAGERIMKRGAQGETVYVNQFYVIRNGQVASKHIFGGSQRLVTKMENNANEHLFYFYHPDHLGSSSYVTDDNGEVFQHVEYFPFGETWVEEHSNRQRTPYLFTGKELDEDTQLYYFGARYYDPRTSVWQSPDPILASYLRGEMNNGVYEPRNLSSFAYAGQNPIRFVDSDGNCWGCETQSDWDAWNAKQADINYTRADTIRNGGGINWVRRNVFGSHNVYEQRGAEYASRIGVTPADQGMTPEARDTLGAIFIIGGSAATRPKTAQDGPTTTTPRTGPVGLVAGRHNANVLVRDSNGNIVTHTRLVSGNQTPAEQALGFPRGSLASHTEARAVRQIPLQRGDTMVITGQRPPCPSCKGYMNRAAHEQGATIRYQWRQDGVTRTWTARPDLD